MSIQAQYAGFDQERGKVKFITAKGEWWMFAGKGTENIAQLQPGTQVEIEANKPEGKNYWRLAGWKPAGASQAPAQPQTAAQAWAAPLAPKPDLTYEKPSDKEEGMFIMGCVGRALGSGKFAIEQIPELTRVAAWAWRTRHHKSMMELQTPEELARPAEASRNLTQIPDVEMGDPGPFDQYGPS